MQIIEQAEKEIEDAQARAAKIESIQAEVSTARIPAGQRIANLKTQLPSLLAARAMGEANQGEIERVKNEIKALKELIEDVPLTLEGLKSLRAVEHVNVRNANRILEKVEKYNLLKERIQSGKDLSLLSNLREYARALGLEEDCEQFIQSPAKYRAMSTLSTKGLQCESHKSMIASC
jgi:hypothetical protein